MRSTVRRLLGTVVLNADYSKWNYFHDEVRYTVCSIRAKRGMRRKHIVTNQNAKTYFICEDFEQKDDIELKRCDPYLAKVKCGEKSNYRVDGGR